MKEMPTDNMGIIGSYKTEPPTRLCYAIFQENGVKEMRDRRWHGEGCIIFLRGHFDILASSTCETFASRSKMLLHGEQTNYETTNLDTAD